MSKEGQPRPFKDTQEAYRQAVESLIVQHSSIFHDDERIWEESQAGVIVEVPNATSIRRLNGRHKLEVPLSVPIDRKQLPMSLRNHNMTQVYLFGDETQGSVSEVFDIDITGERVRQIVKASIQNVLEVSPQEGLDFDSLNFRKPLSDTNKERIYGRGVYGGIRILVESGATYEDLIKQGFNHSQIAGARHMLSKRESQISIPYYSSYTRWEEIIRLLKDSSTSKLIVRELILEINRSTYAKYSKDVPGRPAVFMNIYRIARKAGLYPRLNKADVSFVADYLASKCIPVGSVEGELKSGKRKGYTLRYYFTIPLFVDEAVRVLQTARDERFDQMRIPTVKAVGPQLDRMPTTNDLKGEGYSGVFFLLKNFGINNVSQLKDLGISLTDLVGKNPPVTVFFSSQGLFVEISEAEKLEQYLAERLEEIRKDEQDM